MMDSEERKRNICESYSKDFWEDWPAVLDDLIAKLNDRSYVVPSKLVNGIFRAVLVIDYIRNSFPLGISILDMGCGVGYNSCFLAMEGYQVKGFDGSKTAIGRAKALAIKNEIDPDIFILSDHSYLEQIPDNSLDVAIAMGFIYYLDEADRDYCYRHVHRVLKDQGKFLLTCSNKLFSAFALNDSSLAFWAEMIDDFSSVSKILNTENTFDSLSEKVKVPARAYENRSISRKYAIHDDNPLIYQQVVEPYGYEVEDILYPDCHLLPPALESEINLDALMALKAKTCIQKARNWRGVFMDYEFLVFLSKSTGNSK